MKVLFIHPNFPAQFRHVATALGRAPANTVVFATANPRPEWKIPGVRKVVFNASSNGAEKESLANPLLETVARGEAVLDLCRKLRQQGFIPDVIYGHSGWGCTWFVADVFPESRFMTYCEWYYDPEGEDARFGMELPPGPARRAEFRMRNACIHNDLMSCKVGVAPTRWQRSQFPEEARRRIVQLHDGVDTDYFHPEKKKRLVLPHLDLSHVSKLVTYVSRGMEPYRGFPQFIEALPAILEGDAECHVAIVASERVCYGRPPSDGKSYKEIMLAQVPLDLSRVHFTGTLPYGHYRKVLQASTVHVYLTRPFVLSWSVLEAMACGCLVVASGTPPVKEVIRDGRNGILADFASPQDIAAKVIGALTYPSLHEKVRQRARDTIREHYCLKKLLPRHLDIIRQVAGQSNAKGPFG
jgi:glycosyltransferase involved in cell wall biosynthesis